MGCLNLRSSKSETANPGAEPYLRVRRIIGSRQGHLCCVWTPIKLPDRAHPIQIITKNAAGLNLSEAQDVLRIRLVTVEGHHFHVGLEFLVVARDAGLRDQGIIENTRIARFGRGASEPGHSCDIQAKQQAARETSDAVWALHPSLSNPSTSTATEKDMCAATSYPKH